jgi:hypothetical protein
MRMLIPAIAGLLALSGCVGEIIEDVDTDHGKLMAHADRIAADLNTPEKALAAGYTPDEYCIPGMGVHWINFALFDTNLDPEMPEVVLFLPDSSDMNDTAGDKFLGIEYVVVVEGTPNNSTSAGPSLMNIPLQGPMAGHSPGMPWHKELHIYLADDIRSGADFDHENTRIVCPAGTTPPA